MSNKNKNRKERNLYPMGLVMYFDSSLLPSYLVQWTLFMCYWAVIIISWRILLAGSAGVGFTPHVITVKAGEVCFSAFPYVFMDLIFYFLFGIAFEHC
jgi:hypothetical protein